VTNWCLRVFTLCELTAVFAETLFAAWKVNQPKPIFAEEAIEEEKDDL